MAVAGAAGCLALFAWRYYPSMAATVAREDRGRLFIAIGLYVIVLTLTGFLGARLLWFAEEALAPPRGHHHHRHGDLWDEVFRGGGLTWYGGVLFNAVLLLTLLPLLLRRLPGVPFLRVLDATATAGCLAYAFGRLGCLFTGDGCYGAWTNLPWGTYFPYGPEPTLLPAHPTPLYEAIASVALFIGLLRLERTKRFAGQTLAAALSLSAVARFLVEFIRRNQRLALGLTLSQWISLALLALGVALYVTLPRRSEEPVAAELLADGAR